MHSTCTRFAVGALFCLYVACLLQSGNGQPVEGEAEVAATGDTAKTTSDGLATVFTDTGSAVLDTAKETSKSVEEVIKAGGRTTLAIGSLVSQLLNGVSATVATGTEYLASGVNGVDSYMNGLPIVGTLTGGLSKFVSGFSSAFSDISANARGTRQKMFVKLREQLNQSSSGATATATADSATVAAGTK